MPLDSGRAIAKGLTTEPSLPATTTFVFYLINTSSVSIIKEEGTKAEPDPNPSANTTVRMLLKYNAQGHY